MEYIFGRPEQEAEILDFANYVFSQAHRPHDFTRLLPKVYGRPGFAPLHALAVENGRIRAMAALMPGKLRMGEAVLSTGYVGTVSVHPYARGEGLMRGVMALIHEKAKKEKMDLLMLGGRRHRYRYFGYECAGACIDLHFTRDCLRHAFDENEKNAASLYPFDEGTEDERALCQRLFEKRPVLAERKPEDFGFILKSWEASPYLVRMGGVCRGYVLLGHDGAVTEWALTDGALAPAVAAALKQKGDVHVRVPAFERANIASLADRAEGASVTDAVMARVLNWRNVLSAALQCRAALPIQAGKTVLGIFGAGVYAMESDGKSARVYETNETPRVTLSPTSAVLVLFSAMGGYGEESGFFPAGWLPLPLYQYEADRF